MTALRFQTGGKTWSPASLQWVVTLSNDNNSLVLNSTASLPSSLKNNHNIVTVSGPVLALTLQCTYQTVKPLQCPGSSWPTAFLTSSATSCHLLLLFCGWPSSFSGQNPTQTQTHWKLGGTLHKHTERAEPYTNTLKTGRNSTQTHWKLTPISSNAI